jgi:hypothetical protein
MSAADEFAGIGFAMGSVRGARSFEIDKLGRLTGVVHKQVWTPDENHAECRKRDDPYAVALQQLNMYNYTFALNTYTSHSSAIQKWFNGSAPQPSERVEADIPEPPKHSLDTCVCGFYGYYDGSNDYHKPEYVSGVIEGYGETLIGTRGFRCMKARIVAIHIPDTVPNHTRSLVTRNYNTTPSFPTFESMVAEYPPDGGGHEVTPDTDPEFWTRNV